MITRVWKGRTSAEKATEYGEFLKRMAYPDYGDVEGNRGWVLLRRPTPNGVEFMFVSFWESEDAVRRYAGSDAEKPKYYPEDRAALLELPDRAENYEVLDANVKL
jgi:heme-degrading monooxygenase HmoA